MKQYDKMNPEIKEAWVAALRSGERKQTKGKLRSADGFCCLGVLCDLHAAATGGTWDVRVVPRIEYLGLRVERYEYGSTSSTLPPEVARWAGLSGDNPVIGETVDEEDGLLHDREAASYNDELGFNFNQIANLIEENL